MGETPRLCTPGLFVPADWGVSTLPPVDCWMEGIGPDLRDQVGPEKEQQASHPSFLLVSASVLSETGRPTSS